MNLPFTWPDKLVRACTTAPAGAFVFSRRVYAVVHIYIYIYIYIRALSADARLSKIAPARDTRAVCTSVWLGVCEGLATEMQDEGMGRDVILEQVNLLACIGLWDSWWFWI